MSLGIDFTQKEGGGDGGRLQVLVFRASGFGFDDSLLGDVLVA